MRTDEHAENSAVSANEDAELPDAELTDAELTDAKFTDAEIIAAELTDVEFIDADVLDGQEPRTAIDAAEDAPEVDDSLLADALGAETGGSTPTTGADVVEAAEEIVVSDEALEAAYGAAHLHVHEDGSAPRVVRVERMQTLSGYRDVACARCRSALRPVFPETVMDGVWTGLQAVDALVLTAAGGYGMHIDELGRTHRDGVSESAFVLCGDCTEWLRGEIPGFALVLSRMERW